MSTVVGQSRMVGVWGRRTGSFLPRFLWLTAKKETQQNIKQTSPWQLLLRQTFPNALLAEFLATPPLAVSFHFHPPFIPRKPTPRLISRPLLPSPSPPPSGLLRNRTHTSARKQASFIWGRRRLSVTSTGRRSDWQGGGTGGKFKNKDAFPQKKRSVHDFSFNPRRGRSRHRLSNSIPLRFGRVGIFFSPITKFGEYNVLPDWHKVTFAE